MRDVASLTVVLFWLLPCVRVSALLPVPVAVPALSCAAVSTSGATIRPNPQYRPLSTKTILLGPDVEQMQSNEHHPYTDRRGVVSLDSLTCEMTGIYRKNGPVNTVCKPERDLFPLMRDKSLLALQRLSSPQTRWISLLVLAGVFSSFWLSPMRSVSALSEATALGSAAANLVLPETVSAAASSAGALGHMQTANHATSLAMSPVSIEVQLRLTLRMLYAAILGALVGKERSGSREHRYSRPAGGVRTMALVSLGAATFTLCSMYGFGSVGASRYDPSRMAANVSSGVGFIGAGVITTTAGQSSSSSSSTSTNNCSIVHGLTTAAAIWLSAAVGVGCGVGMSVLSSAAALFTIAILRIGERHQNVEEAKRKLSAQLTKSQRAYEDHLILKELRLHTASNPSLDSFPKEFEQSVPLRRTSESVVSSLKCPSDTIDSMTAMSQLME